MTGAPGDKTLFWVRLPDMLSRWDVGHARRLEGVSESCLEDPGLADVGLVLVRFEGGGVTSSLGGC